MYLVGGGMALKTSVRSTRLGRQVDVKSDAVANTVWLVGITGQSFARLLSNCARLWNLARVHRLEPVSAVKLVDDLAGESPASANYPVGTVVISGDGAGDQTVGSPEVNVLDGWMQIGQLRTGGQAKQQVVAEANRS